MIKGKTKIELFNAETGAREAVYQDENLITNALSYLINLEVCFDRNLDTNVFPVATNALGGILLFDGELDEDPENIYLPSAAHLVGWAGQESGTGPMDGSYNLQESGPTDHGYVSVWDFGTSQANGTIRSVARTSKLGGKDPLWNTVVSGGSYVRNGFPSSDNEGWQPIHIDGEYIYLAKFNGSDNTARLARTRQPMKRHKVADYANRPDPGVEMISEWETLAGSYNSGRYDYNVYMNGVSYYHDGGNGYIYAVHNESQSGNSSGDARFCMFKLRYSDGSWEKTDMQTVVLPGAQIQSIEEGTCRVCNGHIYLLSYDRKSVYIVDADNTVDVRKVQIVPEDSRDYVADLRHQFMPTGGVYFAYAHFFDYGGSQYQNGLLYEDGKYIIHQVAGNSTSSNLDPSYYIYDLAPDKLALAWYAHASGSSYYLGRVNNYLGTVNNLASPVEKNASQTMKITYTLTDAEDE